MLKLIFLVFVLAVQCAFGALLDDFVGAEPAYIDFKMLPDFDLTGEGKGRTEGLSWTAKCVNLTSQVWSNKDSWGADWGGGRGPDRQERQRGSRVWGRAAAKEKAGL